jgi:uncharacterized Zn-finger protein
MPNPRTGDQPGRYPPANSTTESRLRRSDLPLHCPTPETALWASHPRVFIPIHESPDGRMRCPYCGTLYVLED